MEVVVCGLCGEEVLALSLLLYVFVGFVVVFICLSLCFSRSAFLFPRLSLHLGLSGEEVQIP